MIDTICWTLTCRYCRGQFTSQDGRKTEDGFMICPHCNGWSGHEMKTRRPRPTPHLVHDPGQDRLLTDLWAWIVTDPKTTLEGICGFLIDGCPRLAISGSFDEVMRMRPFIETTRTLSSKDFRLVRFKKERVEVEL